MCSLYHLSILAGQVCSSLANVAEMNLATHLVVLRFPRFENDVTVLASVTLRVAPQNEKSSIEIISKIL